LAEPARQGTPANAWACWVVGFHNPRWRTCGASSLPPRYPLKAKWYNMVRLSKYRKKYF